MKWMCKNILRKNRKGGIINEKLDYEYGIGKRVDYYETN